MSSHGSGFVSVSNGIRIILEDTLSPLCVVVHLSNFDVGNPVAAGRELPSTMGHLIRRIELVRSTFDLKPSNTLMGIKFYSSRSIVT